MAGVVTLLCLRSCRGLIVAVENVCSVEFQKSFTFMIYWEGVECKVFNSELFLKTIFTYQLYLGVAPYHIRVKSTQLEEYCLAPR